MTARDDGSGPWERDSVTCQGCGRRVRQVDTVGVIAATRVVSERWAGSLLTDDTLGRLTAELATTNTEDGGRHVHGR